MTKKLLTPVIAIIAIVCCAGLAFAASSSSQTVGVQVSAITEISVSGNPGALNVATATAGQDPDEVSDATTTYSITTNRDNLKITGALNTAMPTGTTLKLNLEAPTGATSAGDVSMSATAADLVTGITKKKGSSLQVTYKLSATVEAGVVSTTSKTVTLTLTN